MLDDSLDDVINYVTAEFDISMAEVVGVLMGKAGELSAGGVFEIVEDGCVDCEVPRRVKRWCGVCGYTERWMSPTGHYPDVDVCPRCSNISLYQVNDDANGPDSAARPLRG